MTTMEQVTLGRFLSTMTAKQLKRRYSHSGDTAITRYTIADSSLRILINGMPVERITHYDDAAHYSYHVKTADNLIPYTLTDKVTVEVQHTVQ